MKKTRIIPEHKENYIICDYCGEEINDYSHTTSISKDNIERHFHSMYAGGSKGNIKKTCFDLWSDKKLNKSNGE